MNDVGTSGHSLKLSSSVLLEWDRWKARSRDYLLTFSDRDGPVLGKDVDAYANAMSELVQWLFEQRQIVRSDINVPDRFRINEPVATDPDRGAV